ncbi:hypothetical protein EON65_21570 [archaeon]|nr:MAG: hypothetical protein EON65_21570 [archaeon]
MAKRDQTKTGMSSEFYLLKETGVRQLSSILSKRLKTLHTHLQHQILPQHTKEAFQEAIMFVDNFYLKALHNAGDNVEKLVVLDSGCGKGMSTEMLARKFPHMPVIGIDRSLHRLSYCKYFNSSVPSFSPVEPVDSNGDTNLDEEDEEISNNNLDKRSRLDNLFLIRADLPAFLSLVCLKSDWIIAEHYILHPNPYPTPRSASYRLYGKYV